MRIFDYFRPSAIRRRVQAKNNVAERIATLKFSVPALRVGVLSYAPGELEIPGTPLSGKSVRLYNPPEAVSAKAFLKSLETAPVIVGVGHGASTGEEDKQIDGWAAVARYDDNKKAAIIDGVIKGKDEVDYIKSNLDTENFGASAFIDFIATVKSGVTPEGEEYDAIAQDLKVTHVALTENVRDPENKIQVRNTAVVNSRCAVINDDNNKSEVKDVEKAEIVAIVKNTIDEVMQKNAEGEELNDMKKAIAEIKSGLETLIKAAGSETAEREAEAGNEDPEKKDDEKKDEDKEGQTVENALPSQAMIAAFSTALNCDFKANTPSFKDLAVLAGIDEADPFKRIVAVNAKYAELSKATAQNAGGEGSDVPFNVFLREVK